MLFLSTLSLRRATACGNLRAPTVPDFYPRSPCGERLGFYADMMALTAISIHALLAESDKQQHNGLFCIILFLSTLSLRRATGCLTMTGGCVADFYPRSPCGERLAGPSGPAILINFYPRSPCGERPPVETINVGSHDFYPRSPCGERLMHTLIFANPVLFLSTLSLRRATLHNAVHSLARNFYPRSPCGERQFSLGPVSSGDKFLSTLSLRRATAGCSRALIVAVISIHALLAESDISTNNHVRVRQNFYPRSPCGERLYRP